MRAFLMLIKRIIASAVIYFLAFHSMQGWAEVDVRAGGKLGISMATLDRKEPAPSGIERALKSGAMGGIYGSLPIHEGYVSIAAQVEVLITQRGTKFFMGDVDLGGYHFLYLDIPLLARSSLPIGDRWSTYALTGPEIALLLSASQTDAGGGKRDIGQITRGYDFGFVVGLGATWEPSVSGLVFLELRYDLGFLFVDRVAGEEGVFNNRTVSFMIGYSPDLFQRRTRASQVRHIEPAGDVESAEPEEVEPDLADEAPSFGPSDEVSADRQDL